jgi:prevent-host-death family protein
MAHPRPVPVHVAKAQLSRLLVRVTAGETVVISRAGQPIAKLVPVTAPAGERVPGDDDVRIGATFDALPASLRRAFGMR